MAQQLKAMLLVITVLAVLMFGLNMIITNQKEAEVEEDTKFAEQLQTEREHTRELERKLREANFEAAQLRQENLRLRGSQPAGQVPQQPPAPLTNPFSTQQPPQRPAASNPFATGAPQDSHPSPPPPPPPPAPPAAVVARDGPAVQPLADSRVSAVLLICYNRPRYLQRALDSIVKAFPKTQRPNIFISQDGSVDSVTKVIETFISAAATSLPGVTVTHLRHTQDRQSKDDRFGYMPLARHFGWALGQVFGEHKAPRVIILEDDLEVAVDFFDYFQAVAPLLEQDETLLAASAWNDLGQAQYVTDPVTIYRSDFFPGLGWMITAKIWEEIGPKWPNGYWDDWLREPPQRKGRAILRPEVSRSYTFGEVGVSQSLFFNKYLKTIKLNTEQVDWAAHDLSGLLKANYDEPFKQAVAGAKVVSIGQIPRHCSEDSRDYRVNYSGLSGPRGYPAVAKQFGFMADVKAQVPRGAYMGVVTVKYHGCRVFIAPAQA